MMQTDISIAFSTNIAPLYVKPLWQKLANAPGFRCTFISAKEVHKGIAVVNPDEFLQKHTNTRWEFVKNIYAGKALIYQKGLVSKIYKSDFDAYVFLGEMYSLSTWISAIICRMRRKPVFFWGHGFYGNEGFLKKTARTLFYKLANFHFLYNDRARELMIQIGFDATKIITVYNSLDYDLHKQLYEERDEAKLAALKKKLFPATSDWPVLLFIGRLTKEKKIYLLFEALQQQKKQGHDFNVLIVGNGEDRYNLESLAMQQGLDERICFYGACYDDRENASLIMLSNCCVSPGNVGLTAIHCMSLGVPVITHNNYGNQGPEVEAVMNGKTGFLFEEYNSISLSSCIDHFNDNEAKDRMAGNCIGIVESKFNPQNQFRIILESILRAIEQNR